MKHCVLLAMSLGCCLIAVADEPKQITRDKSPDGKFALEITKEEEGWSAAIIDLKNKSTTVSLEIYQNYTEEAHLVWSKDSERVAYFEPDRRGGSTTVYFRNGDKFDVVELPELPDCKIRRANGEEHVKTIESTTKAQKWLSSGALELKAHSDELMEKGDNQYSKTCTQIVTVAFDANRKASVQSAKRVKEN
ncbi:MAG TPA: hypothetical protein VJ721_01780 [Chthoniobacterales bacterium]|nr:hypothetical protein [Chthoniobacterales bacterium]